MKNLLKLSLLIFFSLTIVSCGGDDKKGKKEKVKIGKTKKKESKKAKKEDKKTYDLSNKGIGPVSSLELPADIDQAMADKGAEVFKSKCTAL